MGFEGFLELGFWFPYIGSLFLITGPTYEKDLWPKVFVNLKLKTVFFFHRSDGKGLEYPTQETVDAHFLDTVIQIHSSFLPLCLFVVVLFVFIGFLLLFVFPPITTPLKWHRYWLWTYLEEKWHKLCVFFIQVVHNWISTSCQLHRVIWGWISLTKVQSQ